MMAQGISLGQLRVGCCWPSSCFWKHISVSSRIPGRRRRSSGQAGFYRCRVGRWAAAGAAHRAHNGDSSTDGLRSASLVVWSVLRASNRALMYRLHNAEPFRSASRSCIQRGDHRLALQFGYTAVHGTPSARIRRSRVHTVWRKALYLRRQDLERSDSGGFGIRSYKPALPFLGLASASGAHIPWRVVAGFLILPSRTCSSSIVTIVFTWSSCRSCLWVSLCSR
jgi:hypothetical protein